MERPESPQGEEALGPNTSNVSEETQPSTSSTLEPLFIRPFSSSSSSVLSTEDSQSIQNLHNSQASPSKEMYISAFSFLDAVREHRPVAEVERHRKGPKEDSTCTFSYSDALKYSVMYSHMDYCQHLLESHLEQSLTQTVCCPLLLLAVRLDQPQTVQLLCEYSGRKKEHRFYINKKGCSAMECGRTALHIATATGNTAICRVLLRYGADARAKDDLGHTPLHHLLFRLQQPHINVRTVECALELLKCQGTVSRQELAALKNMTETAVASNDNRVFDLSKARLIPKELTTGPFNLRHLSRVVIREAVGYPRLPHSLGELHLPKSLQNYIAFIS